MPIYEYQCTACDALHEALQKISDAPLTDCPACGQPELKKRISAAGFRLTGGGWYETDFKTGDKKKNLSGSDSKEGGSGGKEGGSDGKEGKATQTSDGAAKSKDSTASKPTAKKTEAASGS